MSAKRLTTKWNANSQSISTENLTKLSICYSVHISNNVMSSNSLPGWQPHTKYKHTHPAVRNNSIQKPHDLCASSAKLSKSILKTISLHQPHISTVKKWHKYIKWMWSFASSFFYHIYCPPYKNINFILCYLPKNLVLPM